MLPVWKDVASTLAVSLAPILLLRHPAAVAASLERRNGVEPVVGELMWLRTIRDILHDVGEQLAAIIVHERWFDAPTANKDVIDALASRFELDRRPHWDVPIREEYRGKDLGRAHLALAEEVYSALAAPSGLESRRDVLKMIDNQVAPFESFLAFGREQSRRCLPETSPLPFPREGAAESSGTDAATAELVNGNRWCLENRHGYQLHANKRGFPAACLRWHLVQGKPGQRFTVRVRPSSQQGPQLDLHAEIRLETANEIYRSTTTRIGAGVFQKIELDLPPNERCCIDLSVAIADATTHAHNAGLIIARPCVSDFSTFNSPRGTQPGRHKYNDMDEIESVLSSISQGGQWDKRELIAKLTPGKSFADVGGLWGLHNEMVSLAAESGAASTCMIDIAPRGHEMWTRFEEKLTARAISNVKCIQADACDSGFPSKVGQFDVVHSSGIIYHVPNPINYLLNLRNVTKHCLIVTSMTVPEIIKGPAGEIDLSGGRLLGLHGLDEAQRKTVAYYFNSVGLRGDEIIKNAEKLLNSQGRPDFGPWWWLFTVESVRRLLSAVELKTVSITETWRAKSHTFLCVCRREQPCNSSAH
jgi:hypothetical protein